MADKLEPRSANKLRRRKEKEAVGEQLSLKERLLAILQSDPVVNGTVALAITVGFFHGWLKVKFNSPVVTFLFDALMGIALALVFLQQKKRESFIPKGPVGAALKVFYGLCFVYLLLPMGPPMIISLASMRGWCFATLMFSLGYQLTKSHNQVKGYFYVLLLLGLITAVYGLRQDPASVEQQMEENEVFAQRYQYTYYVTSKGRQLRIFSTFVSSGAFGGTLAYVVVFALALISDTKIKNKERLMLLAVTFPMAYAMIQTGARSALISVGVGLMVIVYYRRNLMNIIVIPAGLALALMLAAVQTSGSAMERFESLLNFDEVYNRIAIPTSIGWQYMSDGNWLGGGMGRSGHSVPLFLADRYHSVFKEYVTADGDLGRLMIEFGLLGLVIFGRVLFECLKMVKKNLDKLSETPLATVSLASGACIIMAITSLPTGSPFLGIPMGAMVWFFVGTLQKLGDEYSKGTLTGIEQPEEAPPPDRRFRYFQKK